MLKIKNNVDLKELEKYDLGCLYNEEDGTIKGFYEKNRCFYDRILKIQKVKNNIIKRMFYSKDIMYVIQNDISVDILYDLIKADLVEKVDGKYVW